MTHNRPGRPLNPSTPMTNSAHETVRLRFCIEMSGELSSLLMCGYSPAEVTQRFDQVVRNFNLAMYQRVMLSRATGVLAPAVWFNVNLGPEVIRVRVVVDPIDENRVTMEMVPGESGPTHSLSLN